MRKKIRRHIIFYGRVQGVGFRYYSVRKARQLGLTGWVKNLVDGSVSMDVQGEAERIDELIRFLKRTGYIQITRMDTKEIPVQEDERDFHEIW